MERQSSTVVEQAARRGSRLPLFAMMAANVVSLIGNRLTTLAIPWYVLETTGSAGRVGLVAFATTLPLIASAFFGTPIIDRLGFRRTSILSDLASAVTVALIPLVHVTGGLAFWQLLALVFLGTVLDAPGHTARQSLMPDLIALASVAPDRANAAMQSLSRLSMLLGPPISGVLISLLGTSNVLWLDAATFIVSALLIALAVPAVLERAREMQQARSFRQRLAEISAGVRFIWQDRLVRVLEIAATLGNALGAALFAVALPVFVVKTSGDPAQFGLLFSCFGAGALVSAVLFGAFGYRLSRWRLFAGALLVGVVPEWIIAAQPPILLVFAAMLLAGLTSGPFGPIITSVFQARVPVDLRARFFGAAYAIDNATTPLAVLLAGAIAEGFGLGVLLIAIAAANMLVTAWVVSQPVLRRLDERPV